TLILGDTLSTTFSGQIEDSSAGGSLTLVKQGPGSFTEAGANPYSGGTPINAGTLALDYATTGSHGAITAGAAGSGAITFGAAGAETLRVDLVALNGTDLAYDIDGFTIGHGVIDLSGITASQASLSGGVLTVE